MGCADDKLDLFQNQKDACPLFVFFFL